MFGGGGGGFEFHIVFGEYLLKFRVYPTSFGQDLVKTLNTE